MVNRANEPPACPHFFAIRMFPALLLSLTFADRIMSRWRFEYCWKASLSYMQTATTGPPFPSTRPLGDTSTHTTATLPNLPQTPTLHTSERALTMSELVAASASGTLREAFCISTAAVVVAMWKQRRQMRCRASCYLLLWRGQHPARALGAACRCSGGARRVGGVGRAMRSRQCPQFRHQHRLPTC